MTTFAIGLKQNGSRVVHLVQLLLKNCLWGVTMGKRSEFKRKKLDFYPTPVEAVVPLLSHLKANLRFCEPCAGDGALIKHLERAGHKCVAAYDVEPQHDRVAQLDASWLKEDDLNGADFIITNPPWDRTPMHQIIARCMIFRPTWMLFDADWMHTRQASTYLEFCHAIVSIGRVKWIAKSDSTGKDNCCWYLFDGRFPTHGKPTFHGRV
jgi:hypothetical protein